MTGSGTLLDPYVIWDVDDLQDMNLDLTAYYELGQNIDASATVGWNGGLGFDPIGSAPSPGGFSGSFDGKGYKIINLTINRPLEDCVGLFGYTEVTCGEIKDVGLENVDMTGKGDVGSLVGFHEYMTDIANGVISNCWATGIVKGEDVLVAGFIGYNGALIEDCWTACDVILTGNIVNVRQNGGFVGLNDRTIRRCYATGNITCEHPNIGSDIQEIGGFAGYHNNGEIDQCFSTGDVLINDDAVALDDIWAIGGFIGDNWGNGIRNCYSRGNVTVTAGTGTARAVGGLIGYNEDECVNCYSVGAVSAPGFTRVGGLVGYNDGTVTDSFWDTETSGQATSEGGTGKTTAEMKDSATFIDAGWGLGTTWGMTPLCNDGYACLLSVTASCAWASIPTVTTNPATLVSRASATLHGSLDSDGGEACECGFQWGLDTGYGMTTPTESKVTGESFSQAIGGLFPGFTYHFRAFATNSVGTGYGADRSFTTTPIFNRAHALSREEM